MRLRSYRPEGIPSDGECDDLVLQQVLQRCLELAHRNDDQAYLLAGWDAPGDGGRHGQYDRYHDISACGPSRRDECG
jgi:hypothetical protein